MLSSHFAASFFGFIEERQFYIQGTFSFNFPFTGDIKDLFNVQLKSGHAAAFASDCDLPSTHEMVRSVGMQVDFCSFVKMQLFTSL